MGCACNKKRVPKKFLWIPPGGSVDGEGTKVYTSKIVAEAKVSRSGGSYIAEGESIPRTVRR